MMGFHQFVTVDGSTGDYSASMAGTISKLVTAPRTGTLDAATLQALQDAYASCDVASLQGVAISHLIPDAPTFNLSASAGGQSYSLSGWEIGLDPQYSGRVKPLLQALESVFKQAFPPVTAPAQPDSNAPQARMMLANPGIAQGPGTVSGTYSVDANGHERLAGLEVLNARFASILDTAGAQGQYVTARGVVTDSGIRITSVLASSSSSDPIAVLASPADDASTIGTVGAGSQVSVTGVSRDGSYWKVRVTDGSGETRTGYVPTGSLSLGGRFSPRSGITQALGGAMGGN
jgi:hypothetical protein